MRAEGLEVIVGAEEISIGGLTEVLGAIPRIVGILRRLARLAAERRPQAAILIDLPDFNLRLAARLKKLGIPVIYYVSPQVWAWRQTRVRTIRKLVDRMLVILPFEEQFYRQHGVNAEFVGHPLVEELPNPPERLVARAALALAPEGPVVAVLPGSRRQEVTRHLRPMLEAVAIMRQRFPKLQAVVPVASTIAPELIERIVEESKVATCVISGRSTDVLAAADVAIVCSGTATLQTALLLRPLVVVYRVSWLTYHILKSMVKVAHITLVNLIANRPIVTELIQHEFTAARLAAETEKLLIDREQHARMTSELAAIRSELGAKGAAARVVEVTLEYVKECTHV